ncbi:MAG: efflux RND transporter periplasmic adaptor subunit [Proteobacteria bacterium]|nr:efflux RND transporter periplasmic adaptor subunit [Pseudomonadota bacterium]
MKTIRIRILAVLAAVLAIAGCAGCHSHDHSHEQGGHDHAPSSGRDDHAGDREGHGHEHGDDAIGITRWTEKLELFAEHPPAVTGQELTFLAHLTILDGFKALDNATVTLVLEGPERIEASVTEMLRSGIFRPVLTARRPGSYRGSLVIAGPEVRDTVDGFEIAVHPSGEAARQPAGNEQQDGAEPISFLKEQQWQVPFATAFATRDAVVPFLEVAGEITTPPGGQADIGAAIAGRVVAPPGGLPRPGQAVRSGELLATIAPIPAAPEAGVRANLAVVEAETRVQGARAALERAERLIADRAISQREVDDARRELRVAEESVQAARRARDFFSGAASGRGGGTYRVATPISGVIVDVRATAGKSVTSGEQLFRVVDLSELWIRARVPEQQASRLRSDQDASFKLPGLDSWLPLDVTGDDASASVVTIGRTVNRPTRTVDVIYALRQPDERLRVGGMVRVGVPTGAPWQGVVVPRGAVLEDDGRAVVYVQVEGEAFEERTVRLGPRSRTRVGIERGIDANERVVTYGANVIRLASRASTAPAHGHVH